MILSEARRRYEENLIILLRLGLALIFIWFGLLKVAGYNPVAALISSVSPFLASGIGLTLLGIFETLIGIGLLANRARLLVHTLLVLHLAGTFLTFFTDLSIVFVPHFPILSLDGEFVIKNLVLATAGLLVLLHQSKKMVR
jgi:uncharacterized membrane protein YkgB